MAVVRLLVRCRGQIRKATNLCLLVATSAGFAMTSWGRRLTWLHQSTSTSVTRIRMAMAMATPMVWLVTPLPVYLLVHRRKVRLHHGPRHGLVLARRLAQRRRLLRRMCRSGMDWPPRLHGPHHHRPHRPHPTTTERQVTVRVRVW